MKKIFFIFITCFANYVGNSQSVNPFTGSFNYGFPLINLPSNRGTGISIDASYNAGIQMNQPASEIGLGWSLNAGGAIYRSVSGIPDDFKNYPVTNPGSLLINDGQGALYPEATSATVYDLVRIKKGMDTAEFTMPDFDSYNIVAPEFSGQLKLSYYKYYPYKNESPGAGKPYNFVPKASPMGISYRRPQFHFAGDFADTLVSRHYPDSINSSTSFRAPNYTLTALGYTNSNQSFVGKHLSGSTVSNQNFDIATGRIATSNFVEYFTNDSINSGTITGMVDYKTSATRPSSVFPSEGIGYFRVTGSNGLTYHYSLPVYQLENTVYRHPLNNDYSLTGLSVANFTTANNIAFSPSMAAVGDSVTIKIKEENKFAVKWLLTAITAADYVDVNNNRIVDQADGGYWVAYDYQLWNSSAVQRYPKYGYDYQYSPDQQTQEYPLYFPLTAGGAGWPHKLSGLYGVVTVNKSEVYHLARIRTSSHSAIFIKDIRKDEKTDDEAIITTNTFTPAPELLVKRIILFKNEQIDSILGASPTLTFNTSNYSQFNFSTINNTAAFFNEAWYNNTFPANDHCILKHIYFDQDYSLCKKYQGNVEVRCDNSNVLTLPTVVQTSLAVGTNSVSGKLTLKRILTYDFQNQKIIPSTVFDYDQANVLSANSNPDYNPLKADYWGYYKSDATTFAYSRYTNTTSKSYTKAWSLLKITDPLGGITEMEYESNSYNKVLDNQSPGGIRGAAFVYRIKDVIDLYNTGSSNYEVVMEEANTNTNSVNEISYLNASLNCFRRIVMPYYENVCTGAGSCVSNASFKGFQFGDCDLTLNFTLNNAIGTITAITSVGAKGVTFSSSPLITRSYFPSGSAGGGLQIQNSPATGTVPVSPAYSGNGYILLETAIGYNVYGGGIRVKKIKSRNSATEVYEKLYTYEDGVATNEMDRFAYPRLKAYATSQSTVALKPRYGFLEPKSFEKFEMNPYIGYTKVTVKDLGRINTDNGKIESTFITDPGQLSHALRKNYAIYTYTNHSSGVLDTTKVINECSNVFANIFGATKETRVYDKNNNMMTRTANEYTLTQQGAVSELFYFENPEHVSSLMLSYTVNIIRDIPIVLKSTTSYGMGSFEKTQTIARDEWTGETTSMQSTGKNNSSSISFKLPGYKHYHAVESVDFTSAASRKIFPLGHDMYTYGNIDSTITTNSFLSAAYKLYSRTMRQWDYNGSVFAASTATLPYYFNNRSFIFDAGIGSMNDYGLLDKSNLYSNPLNLSTINNNVYWEPSGFYNWKLASEVTLMDANKHLVETRDANNRFSACRYGYDGYYKTASVTNCNYPSFTYAGFETAATHTNTTMDGDVLVSTHTLVPNTTLLPHTGFSCIGITSNPVTFISSSAQSPSATLQTGILPGRTYRASVWTYSTNASNAVITVTVSGDVDIAQTLYPYANTYSATTANNLVTTIGNWSLIQLDFLVPEGYSSTIGEFKIELISANGSAVYFDDFVFHPVESDFSASVFNPRNGRLMSSLDGNGLATNYFYDASGRVTEVWKEIPSVGYKKIKKHTYNYARGAAN